MGHADPSITLRVYGYLFNGVQQQLTDRLEHRRQAAENSSQLGQLIDLDQRRNGQR